MIFIMRFFLEDVQVKESHSCKSLRPPNVPKEREVNVGKKNYVKVLSLKKRISKGKRS